MPARNRLAPILPALVLVLRNFTELDIDAADTADLLVSTSAATIEPPAGPERVKHGLRGHPHTKLSPAPVRNETSP
ncbi:hypothetical protein ACFWAY_32385 [Rhodococcus sp. NPDC059968]|uniref:hypothetical protein n=1 Tax=Rhodococcus sp. NPDC059968 TaxID=3347017 RepID=UPI00366AFA8C